MSKVKEMVKAMITEEQLKTVQDQQAKLSELLKSIGVLDVQRMNLHSNVKTLSEEIEVTKKELEKEYGQVNINLTDGTYSEIEKDDAK